MKEINIMKAPIFSKYFSEFINCDDEYTMTDEFMKENVFITGVCNCGESFCSTVYLTTRKPFQKSVGQITSNMFDSKMIHLHTDADDDFVEFEAISGELSYMNEVLNLLRMTMYLDEIKTPTEEFDFIVRSYDEAIEIIKKHGMPNYISFGHDLGINNGKLLKNGCDFAKWLVNSDVNNDYELPFNFEYKVHSGNTIDKQNIITLLDGYLKHKQEI